MTIFFWDQQGKVLAQTTSVLALFPTPVRMVPCSPGCSECNNGRSSAHVLAVPGASGGGIGISEGIPPRTPSRTNSAGNHSDYGGGGSSVYSADLSPPGGM